MKIAILGPPGVGKTKLARALAKDYKLGLVDGYVQRLQKQSDLALGPWSTYSEHFMGAGARMIADAKSRGDTVTAGTIIDSIAYAAVKSDVVMHSGPQAAREIYDAASAAMKGLALIYHETWDYHLAFHLGYNEAQRKERAGTWELALDASYAAVVESFEVPYVYGLSGNPSDRLTIAKEVIDLARTSVESVDTDEVAETPQGTGGFPAPPDASEAQE